MLWKIASIVMLLVCQSVASDLSKPEEPTIAVGMSYGIVTSTLQERSFKKLSEKTTVVDSTQKRILRYRFKPRNDITPIHPSWHKSQLEFRFLNEKLEKINWYKKDGSALKLDMDKIYLGPK